VSKETKKTYSNQQQKAAARALLMMDAKDDLLKFTQVTMPHPEDPDDLDRSRYSAAKHHKILSAALEEVDRGHIPRLIVTMPPRHGKSELVSKRFLAWMLGRDPYKQIMFATYNEDFAGDFGVEVREIMMSPQFKQIFPGVGFRKGGAAKDRIQTSEGGIAVFKGRGGALTGRGADRLVIDDILKDAEEADSPTTREKCWQWFTKVAMTRLMPGAAVVIVITRWNEDDIVGRLTDPTNPCYNAEEAKRWKVIKLPFFAEEDDPMGREKGETLWPERFDEAFGIAQRQLNPRGFSALYQQRPTPEDGDFFKRDWIKVYKPSELPKELKYYAASDHAVGTKQTNDATVLLTVGVDENDDIWVLDCWWRRKTADHVVDAMLQLMQTRKPLIWWDERGHISQSIVPFLRKRMLEERTYINLHEVTPAADKQTRAQSIQGRMAMGKVHFPENSTWLSDAMDEMLKFPHHRHDDFVDALAYIGLGLGRQVSAAITKPRRSAPKVGTLAWVKADSNFRKRQARYANHGGF
jgi:predicted phage terminase large subunit-like protein